jgi:hypothetical protein
VNSNDPKLKICTSSARFSKMQFNAGLSFMAMYKITKRKDVCNPAKYVGRLPPTLQQISCIKNNFNSWKIISMPMKFRARNSINQLQVPPTDRKRLSVLKYLLSPSKACPLTSMFYDL